ncbi:MAG: hypothetical protein CMG74_02145 [Candidatus Marinimicrobia bacterium]|nr:hypothetical protein [Candidatus Neomarinimicrobiota bacterium]
MIYRKIETVILIIIKKRPISGLFLWPLFFSIIFGIDYNPKISYIEFRGNDKTKDFIIEREIQHQINTNLDSALADKDRNRLENLGLFSEVSWKAVPLYDDTAILQFIIVESIQKTPPIVLPAYDEKTGWALTGVWIIQNFRGRNQQLSIGSSFGGRDSYTINFNDPWMFGNHVSLDFSIGRTSFEHLFLDRTVISNYAQLEVGRWFGEHIKTTIGTELAEKYFSNSVDTLLFNYIKPKWFMAYDTRDLFWNPGHGFYIYNIFHIMLDRTSNKNSALVWKQSYSRFFQLGNSSTKKLVMALNITMQRRWGNKSNVWLTYFGGSYSVRGWKLPDRKLYSPSRQSFRFGHEYVQGSLELRKEIIPKFATNYKFETGLSVVGFIDAGLIAFEWQKLKDQALMTGTGFGIRIPFPMIDVIRLDLSWGFMKGKWNSPVFHWGVTQKF